MFAVEIRRKPRTHNLYKYISFYQNHTFFKFKSFILHSRIYLKKPFTRFYFYDAQVGHFGFISWKSQPLYYQLYLNDYVPTPIY